MQTLTYGYKKPGAGDGGAVFYPALEFNIQRLNDHTHNGSNSSKLNTSATEVLTVDIEDADWDAVANGTYRQSVALPGALTYDKCMISCKDTDTGNIIYPTIEKIDANNFYVYTNDSTKNYTMVFTS